MAASSESRRSRESESTSPDKELASDDHYDIVEIKTDIKYIRLKLDNNCTWQQRTDGRINSLECWRSCLAGGFALLVILMGYGLIVPGI